MNSSQIEKNVKAITENFISESFIYDLLLAYGISKTSITRLKSGDFNLSKNEGEVLYKKKVFFKVVESNRLLLTIDELTKDEDSLKHNPRFVIVTDYKTLLAKDIRTAQTLDISILEIPKHYDFFLPWAGQEKYQHKNENHADRKASYEMAKLYDILVHENEGIYDDGGHNLNIFLSRLLFCFFAEDTNIFPEEGMFTAALSEHTKPDGSDVHEFLNKLFTVLNSENNSHEANYLQKFPYVNGGLFRDTIHSPKFSLKARKILLECGELDWSEINPDIFGSMIQAVVNPEYRSGLGMHYTSVPNIMKVIEPLFLNELYDEFEKNKDNDKSLRRLINRLSKIKVFDPACGSGNFLIIAYKEIRKLEIEIWKQIDLLKKKSKISYQTETVYTEVYISQFYGIELDDFAHEMGILSLWLAQHQMDKTFVDELFDFGRAEPILPLKSSGNIFRGNATRIDWRTVCDKKDQEELYVLGNPPYVGSRKQKTAQKDDLKYVFSEFKKYKDLDYIAIWFYKGAQYISETDSSLAFVSTNSICQGEQVSLIWPQIFKLDVGIDFAYPSFKWRNNAKDVAGVTVVIVGLKKAASIKVGSLYFDGYKKDVDRINAYLIPVKSDVYVRSHPKAISWLPKINHGNMPADGGKLLFTTSEKNEFIAKEPNSEKWFKQLVTAKEHLNGRERWCLWLEDISITELNNLPKVKQVTEEVKFIREKSSRPFLAETPHLFAQITQPKDMHCLIVPRVSSENREYLPIDFLDGAKFKVTDSYFTIATEDPYIFGIIASKMHMVWMKSVGGRLETRIQYSKNIVYNTFPIPEISKKDKENLNLHVLQILEEREKHSEKTLAKMYDPIKMPKSLKEAHKELDLALERCYRLRPFSDDTERLEHLFKLYQDLQKS